VRFLRFVSLSEHIENGTFWSTTFFAHFAVFIFLILFYFFFFFFVFFFFFFFFSQATLVTL